MTPERLQEIRTRTHSAIFATADRWALLAHIDAQDAEIAALRRGQGTAPAPATPGTTRYHTTDPIPDSTGGTR